MTLLSSRATISAEWALWGKDASDTEYRLLRCSSGVFSSRDFVYAIDRYSPGTLEARALPQVSVSWLRHPETGLPSHLGLAIHETADDDDPRGGPVRSRFDAAGREIVYVRYFCVPYDSITDCAVGSRQLYETFRRRPLPVGDRGPVTVGLAAPERHRPEQAEDQFARHVAAQLLTTRPVCVLGAEDLPLRERLRFIDLVMSWLPYGARSQLSATTWVNSNFTGHKHRLFFASAPRDEPRAIEGPAHDRHPSGRKPDIVVEWGHLDTVYVTDQEAVRYLSWDGLDHRWARGVLAHQTAPVSLGHKDSIREMLRSLEIGRVDSLTVPDTLRYLGEELSTPAGNDDDIPRYIENLTAKTAGRLDKAAQEECWALIADYGLLADGPRAGKWRDRYYDALLRAVLDGPVTYADYLRVTDAAGSPLSRNPALLSALGRRLTTTRASVPWLLIRRDLGDTNEELVRALARDSVSPMRLAERLVSDAIRTITRDAGGEPPLRPEHGRVLFDPVMRYLLEYEREDRAGIRNLGYLAPALYVYFADDQRAQMDRAVYILRSVYGERLDRNDIEEVLGARHAPTDTLLAAVVSLAPDDLKQFAMTEYGRVRVASLVPAAPGHGGQTHPRRLRPWRRPGRSRRDRPASPPATKQGGPPPQFRTPLGEAIVFAVLVLALGAIVFIIFVELLTHLL